jgi:hypothetical protein
LRNLRNWLEDYVDGDYLPWNKVWLTEFVNSLVESDLGPRGPG